MEWELLYQQSREHLLSGRYVPFEAVSPIIDSYKNVFKISVEGRSEKGNPIHLIQIGNGEKSVLMWSQMHGNETTTTKAVFDFLKFLKLASPQIKDKLKEYSIFIIPMLNPDGANRYTRFNANDIDLNRDAQNLTQSESKTLQQIYLRIQPDVCLNLHDQRTIYGLPGELPATISFLPPAADVQRSVTPSRKEAMRYIELMTAALEKFIPGQVGRYDDSFNINCIGDTLMNRGIPTILIEAGHFQNDYSREETRRFVFLSLLTFFELFIPELGSKTQYADIPENENIYRDVILRGLITEENHEIDVAVQYREVLIKGAIHLQAIIDDFGSLSTLKGWVEIENKKRYFPKVLKHSLKKGDDINSLFDKKEDFIHFLRGSIF